MNPLRAFSYLAVFMLLLGYYVAFEGEEEASVAAATPVAARWIDLAAVDVVGVVLRSPTAELRTRKADGRWYAAGPLQQSVPPDLVPSLLDSLLATAPVESLGNVGAARLSEFGLDRDERSIDLEREDGSKVTLRLGASNPSRTAVYAMREGGNDVVLVGLNVDYYFTLGIAGATGGTSS